MLKVMGEVVVRSVHFVRQESGKKEPFGVLLLIMSYAKRP